MSTISSLARRAAVTCALALLLAAAGALRAHASQASSAPAAADTAASVPAEYGRPYDETPAPAVPDTALIEHARLAFRAGRYARVVTLLAPGAAADSLEPGTRAEALELLARSRSRVGDIEGGVASFGLLLDARPLWQPDPRQLGDEERAVFERARREWREAHPDEVRRQEAALADRSRHTPWYRQRRFQLAGGAATAALVAVIRYTGRSDGSNKALPALPGHP